MQRIAPVLILLASTCLAPGVPASAEPPLNPLAGGGRFAGLFLSDELAVEIKVAPGGYAGSIRLGDQAFTLKAREVGGTLEGGFQSQGHDFSFQATLKDRTLTFTTEGTTYTLQKQSLNPLARPAQPVRPRRDVPQRPPEQSPDGEAPGDAPGEVEQVAPGGVPDEAPGEAARPQADAGEGPRTGKTYRHPLGFSFGYPATWNVQETQAGLQLVPPDVATSAQGALEAYLIIGQPAAGITKPDDPRVVQFFDQQVLSFAPFLQRSQKFEVLKTGGQAAAGYLWEGKSPIGVQSRMKAYVVILKGYAIGLIAVGATERIEAREGVLREMFTTFGFGEGEKDPRLVGAWRYEHYYSTKDFSSTSIKTTVLRPDGSFSSSGQTMANAQHRDGGGDLTGSTMLDTGESAGDRGRWGAGGSKLFLIWDDGSYAEYQYHVEGQPGARNLLLVTPDGKKQLWTEVQ
ncbi:MAG: hypothetical protein HYU36_08025 [Planctomycetes bacterium]|nr:hypothetical protein [Planctomycetota bacterium]